MKCPYCTEFTPFPPTYLQTQYEQLQSHIDRFHTTYDEMGRPVAIGTVEEKEK